MIKGNVKAANHQVLDKRKIIFGFVAVVLIVMGVAVNHSYQINKIIRDYDSLIEQPVAVAYASKTIKFHIANMNNMVLNLMELSKAQEIDKAIVLIAKSEKLVVKEYKSILAKSSSDKEAIHINFQMFKEWRPLRETIYKLIKQEKLKEAKGYYRTEAFDFLEELQKNIESIEVLAHKKVDKFQGQTAKISRNIVLITLILSVLAILFVSLLMYLMWRSIASNERARSHRQTLIDEQILIAILDKEGRIEDVSSALCKFLGCWKEELVETRARFFLDSDKNNQLLENNILNMINQGKEWHGEISYTKHDGEKVWAESAIVPNFDDQFQISGYTNILHDLTSKKLASIDKLTSLLNRRSYDETLRDQISIAVRNKYPISLAILDIDYFKRFNDLYGHPEGDTALKTLSSLLAECMQRPSDYVFRIGGEEFAILISGLDIAKTTEFLNSIKEKVKALQIPNKNSSLCPYLTVSVGAVVLLDGAATEQQLYKAADHSLYEAKTERDLVVVSPFIEETSKSS